MSSDRDGFDDRRNEGAGWQEPAHLGKGDLGRGDLGRGDLGRGDLGKGDLGKGDLGKGDRADDADWEPPGWSLPSAEPQREAPQREVPQSDGAEQYPSPPPAGGFFRPSPRRLTEGQALFRYQGDLVGAQGWALQHGWAISDGTGPEDAVLAELLAAAPVRRLSKDHRPAGVMRGRAGTLELVAFDVVYPSGRHLVPQYAVTAAPVLLPLPRMRLTPARFWQHGTGGLLQIPSGDEEFDTRWVLLSADDSPDLRRLVQDRTVRGLLLGSDDGDEFWTAAGHVAAIRPDGQRPSLIEHHARLLDAVVGALAGA